MLFFLSFAHIFASIVVNARHIFDVVGFAVG